MKTSWWAVVLVLLGLVPGRAGAAGPTSTMHPTFPPLDANGRHVTESGVQISPERTCGGCHDAEFIASHSSHDLDRTGATCATCHVDGGNLTWSAEQLDEAGRYKRGVVDIRDPQPRDCARCHGVVSDDAAPLTLPADLDASLARWGTGMPYELTLATGQILAPQKMADSAVNLAGRDNLNTPFDVHAARLVTCTSCHFAPNNPGRVNVDRGGIPFLDRDPRRPSISDYIHRPDHQLAATRCEQCHNAMATHDALPYKDRHMAKLECTSCHVAQTHGPVLRTVDQTVVTPQGTPHVEYRNMDGAQGGSPSSRYLRTFRPFLVVDEATQKVGPANLITEWRWVSGSPATTVPLAKVASAFLENGTYAKVVVAALDRNADGNLSSDELRLDTDARVRVIRDRLAAQGVPDPRIEGTVTVHHVHHGVQANEGVVFECTNCHSERSPLGEDVALSGYQVAGVSVAPPIPGTIEGDGRGGLVLRRPRQTRGFYVLGHDRVPWTDTVGFLVLLATTVGVATHGALRIRNRRVHGANRPTVKAYVYSRYERIWHWLMALSILLLLWTGIEIHWVGGASVFGFTQSVWIHNALAAVLIVNAFLSLFYHVASNEIRQLIPPRETFLGEAIAQAKFYLNGIFVGAPHPVPKSRERKLNPLQQVTYLMLLNVLIPLQVVTGVLIWGAPRWPALSNAVGGLTIVTPVHSLGAWLLATFVVAHVYLTTTGHTPLSNIRAMVVGEDEIDAPPEAASQGGQA